VHDIKRCKSLLSQSIFKIEKSSEVIGWLKISIKFKFTQKALRLKKKTILLHMHEKNFKFL